MKLRKTHAVRILDYQRVDIWDVNSGFDYCGADEYVYLTLEQSAPNLAELILTHLAVGYAHCRLRQKLLYAGGGFLYRLDTIVQIVDLTSPAQLGIHRLCEHLRIIFDNIGLNRRTVMRRLLEN